LRDVDRAAAKSALAIHQIVTPEIVEFRGEPAEITARDRRIVTLPPLLEGLGIIQPETVAVLPRQSALARQRLEPRLVERLSADAPTGEKIRVEADA
jgi:hypothetical protein